MRYISSARRPRLDPWFVLRSYMLYVRAAQADVEDGVLVQYIFLLLVVAERAHLRDRSFAHAPPQRLLLLLLQERGAPHLFRDALILLSSHARVVSLV